MARFIGPASHPSHNLVQIISEYTRVPVAVEATEDGKEPALVTEDGKKTAGYAAIAKQAATLGDTRELYPLDKELIKSQIDKWLKLAEQLVNAAGPSIEAPLDKLESWLSARSMLVAESVSLADVAVKCAVDPLVKQGKLGSDKYSSVGQWLAKVEEQGVGTGKYSSPPRKPVPMKNQTPPAQAAPTPPAQAAPTPPLQAAPTLLLQSPTPPGNAAAPTPPAQAAPTPPLQAAPPPPGNAAAPTPPVQAAAPESAGALTPNGGAPSVGLGGPDSSSSTLSSSINNNEADDPQKAAKKAAKLAEKEAKKAKAAAKAAAKAEAAAAPKKSDDGGKKAKAKAEAEAKKAAEAEEIQRIIKAARATPPGQKKSMSDEMAKGYLPLAVEAGWYDWWMKCGYFKADDNSDKEPFVIVIPPPNVTGALHIGHALTNAIEDTVVRWRRMSGYNTLWVPGTDHAGIATQTVVEKKIQREMGKTRHDLGRDQFLEEVHSWVGQYRNKINDQLSRLGSSLDWDRKVFTMDESRSAAVKEAFLRLYADGLIYRDNRLVNWDCILKTAVSDIEVDYVDIPKRTLLSVPGYDQQVEFGVLTSFAYPLEDGSGEIVVATTRPETMLGDTAVAVHPDDTRYTHLHGKFVIHPFLGRRIPIITDAELVDPAFGTGAVKITPAHDPNDFATGKRHQLEFINMLDDDGVINHNGGLFEGQPRFKARVTVVDALKEKGLFRGTEDNPMRLGLCSRSKDVIEPVIKPQWWVSCGGMAAEACDVVRDGRLEIIPKEYEATWFRWMENIRDWCVSRQLWWGHRIPAYYVTITGEEEKEGGRPGAPSERMDRWVIASTQEEAEKLAAEKFPGKEVALIQDEDVLDTWFSSGLFPFSVFNWPEQTADLGKYYPTWLLETGSDILFFWVARMVMMGMKLTGQVPFKQVYLHSIVRDAHGRKMSKALGNVIDPVHIIEGISLQALHGTLLTGNLDPKEVEKATAGQKADFPDGIEECGADALRFALMAYTSQGRDINLDIKRVVAYRHWCNKLWNAIRFAMMNLGSEFVPDADLDVKSMWFPCRWILSRLNAAIGVTVKAMNEYEFSTATQALYSFWQYELCDVMIEVMKPVLRDDTKDEGKRNATRQTLWLCLDNGLRLLHPFMPFVTEELWQRLPKRSDQLQYGSIMISPYPTPQPHWEDPQAEAQINYLNTVVARTRQLRADYQLTKERPPLLLACKEAATKDMLSGALDEISTLASCSSATILERGAAAPSGCGVAVVDDQTTVYLSLAGILDAAKEIEKLQKKAADLIGRKEAIDKKRSMPEYSTKTPENVQKEDAERMVKLDAELEIVTHHIDDMKKLLST